jgi:hypothetical protein
MNTATSRHINVFLNYKVIGFGVTIVTIGNVQIALKVAMLIILTY